MIRRERWKRLKRQVWDQKYFYISFINKITKSKIYNHNIHLPLFTLHFQIFDKKGIHFYEAYCKGTNFSKKNLQKRAKSKQNSGVYVL